MPIIYEAFKEQIQILLGTGAIPQQFVQFGGGDLFTLPGTIALGFIHPIAVALGLVFALGFAVNAVAGERQRGTLEVLLARPVSRRRLYVTLLVATILFVAVAMAAQGPRNHRRAHRLGCAGGRPAGAAGDHVAQRRRWCSPPSARSPWRRRSRSIG